MARRPSQSQLDKRAFPVRVRVWVPVGGFGGTLDAMEFWLRSELEKGDWSLCSGVTGVRSSVDFLFRSVAQAQRFLDQFPDLELADATTIAGYTSPSLPYGRK